MGGREAPGISGERHPGARMIVSSRYSNDSVPANWRHYGFNEVPVKTFSYENVVEVLRKLVI